MMDSRTASFPLRIDDLIHSNFTFSAGLLGCNKILPREELTCMRNGSVAPVESFLEIYQDDDIQPAISFSSVIDNRTKFAKDTARELARSSNQIVSLPR